MLSGEVDKKFQELDDMVYCLSNAIEYQVWSSAIKYRIAVQERMFDIVKYKDVVSNEDFLDLHLYMNSVRQLLYETPGILRKTFKVVK